MLILRTLPLLSAQSYHIMYYSYSVVRTLYFVFTEYFVFVRCTEYNRALFC
jgi:hypothetical protein